MRNSLKMWEVVKGMNDEKFLSGTVFRNEDCGDMIISEDDELIWIDDATVVSMQVNDMSEWTVIIEGERE